MVVSGIGGGTRFPISSGTNAVEGMQKAGTPGAGSQQVRLDLLRQLVAKDQAATLPTEVGALDKVLQTAPEGRISGELTQAQRDAGFCANRISVELAGNSHFHGWWNVVGSDTQVLVVQSPAYKGCTVKAGFESWSDARVVYFKKNAGLSQTTFVDLVGRPGEDVRLLSIRMSGQSSLAAATLPDGSMVTALRDGGRGNTVGGDPHWRDVHIKLNPTKGTRSEPSLERFDHYQNDIYRGHPQGKNSKLELYATGPDGKLVTGADGKYVTEEYTLNANGFLGGDADERYVRGQIVTPM